MVSSTVATSVWVETGSLRGTMASPHYKFDRTIMKGPQAYCETQTGRNLTSSSEQNIEVFSVRVLVHVEMIIQHTLILYQGGRVARKISGLNLTFYF